MDFHGHAEEDAKIYRPSLHGEEAISPDFTVGEFACSDGTDVMLVHLALVELWQAVRDEVGAAVYLTSGFRTAAYNKKIGGAENSRHLYGLAGDGVTPAATPEEVAQIGEDLGAGGVGRYDDFTHLDVFGSDRRWDRRSDSDSKQTADR
jgi:uncharacterized protein YcbK (DUF882 family)